MHSLTSASALSLLLVGRQVSAAVLYVSSYFGLITTLALQEADDGYTLREVGSNDECGTSPSWLDFVYDEAAEESTLYCVDEGFGTWPIGHIASFSVVRGAELQFLDSQETLVGGVSSQRYGPDDTGLAVAYYAGSGFATWDITDPTNIEPLTEDVFEGEPGPEPEQEAPHPHQAIADPTGRFIIVPDLGTDIVRIYAVNENDLTLAELDPLEVPAGSGPRHAAFAVHGETTYVYVLTELANTILGYEVSYGNGTIGFEQVWESGSHGQGIEVPSDASGAEIVVTPDQNFLIVSSRNESAIEIPDFENPENGTTILSDVLINFSIDPTTGSLETLQEVAAGGMFPRHFSLNPEANLVAVALQSDGRVVVIERDVESGLLGDFIAHVPVEGETNMVIFHPLNSTP